MALTEQDKVRLQAQLPDAAALLEHLDEMAATAEALAKRMAKIEARAAALLARADEAMDMAQRALQVRS